MQIVSTEVGDQFFNIKKFHNIIGEYFEIIDEKIDPITLIPIFAVKVNNREEILELFNKLFQEIVKYNFYPKLSHKLKINLQFENLPEDVMYITLFPQIYENEKVLKQKKNRIWVNWVLFISTLIMVAISGYVYIYIFDPIHGGLTKPLFESVIYILYFVISILGIIAAHEFGHYYTLKKYNLGPSIPYFIPAIPPLGTFGAFVKQKNPAKNRNQLYDIGISGPIAGFILAIIFTTIGLLLTVPIPTDEYLYAYVQTHNTYFYSITLEQAARKLEFNTYNLYMYLFRLLVFGEPTQSIYYGQLLPDYVLQLHPLAFGGFIGLILTAINSLPAGKLDGGHVARAMFGKLYWIGTIIGIVILFFIDYFMVFLLFLLGGLSRHEGPLNDTIVVSKNRKIGYIGLILIIIFSIPLGSLTNLYTVF
ncbi:MAG: site-2 protease family protein [Candidatus Helarchaeota archaeon]